MVHKVCDSVLCHAKSFNEKSRPFKYQVFGSFPEAIFPPFCNKNLGFEKIGYSGIFLCILLVAQNIDAAGIFVLYFDF